MTLCRSWPNVVTVGRLLMVAPLVMLTYSDNPVARLSAPLIAIGIIVGDWLDGHLARRLGQTSSLGSVLDIAADRVLENVMWIILADLGLIPVWIPVVVIARGILTDAIRGYALKLGYAGFGENTMQKSTPARFITGSPLMRSPYAVLKAATFAWLLGVAAFRGITEWLPLIPPSFLQAAADIGLWGAILCTVVCIVRGLPVIIEGTALIAKENGCGR